MNEPRAVSNRPTRPETVRRFRRASRRVDRFPRVGTHLHHPPPEIPVNPAIEIRGAVTESFSVSLARLATLQRREQTADLHCVAGWSATRLRWEGVPFAAFYRDVIEPALAPDKAVTHF